MTTQNNNEHLSGESNSRENFENEFKYPSEIIYVNGLIKEASKTAIIFKNKPDIEQMREFYKEQLKERE